MLINALYLLNYTLCRCFFWWFKKMHLLSKCQIKNRIKIRAIKFINRWVLNFELLTIKRA